MFEDYSLNEHCVQYKQEWSFCSKYLINIDSDEHTSDIYAFNYQFLTLLSASESVEQRDLISVYWEKFYQLMT